MRTSAKVAFPAIACLAVVSLAIACLSGLNASAEGLRVNDGRAAANFGVGGWTQNSVSRPQSSGAITLTTSVTAAPPTGSAGRGVSESSRRLYGLGDDSGCLFAPAAPFAGRPWRPGCK